MSEILVNVELMKSQSDSFGLAAEELGAKIQRLDEAVQVLQNAVHGEASGSLLNQWEVAMEAMKSYIPKLQDVQARLANVAQTNTDLDTNLKESIHVETV